MAWIESHQSLGRHPKTKATARALGISRVQLVGHMHYLWWWALDFAEEGDLSRFDPADIAEEAMWDDDPDEFINGLVSGGFLTEDMQINDWDDYTGRLRDQREKNRERQRRFRERHRAENTENTGNNGDETLANDGVTVTSPLRNGATVPNQTKPNRTGVSNDTPKREGKSTDLSDAQLERFERWYQHWPKKKNRGTAEKAWKSINPSDDLVEQMIAKTKAWAASHDWTKESRRYVPNPASWLNGKGWLDDDPPADEAHPANVTPFQNSNRNGKNGGWSPQDYAAYAEELERQGR